MILFRFRTTNIQHLKTFVKYPIRFQLSELLFHDSWLNYLPTNRNGSLVWNSKILKKGSTWMYFLFAPMGMENIFPATIFTLERCTMTGTYQSYRLNAL